MGWSLALGGRVGAAAGVAAVLGVGVAVDVVDAQSLRVMTLVSSVTSPLRASARPCSRAPVFIAIEVRAMMLPSNRVAVSSVAELPIRQ